MNNRGLGCSNFEVAVYIGNIPNMPEFQYLSEITALSTGEIHHIGQMCGNGWRKVFNVYAKVLFALDPNLFNYAKNSETWQKYRDDYLLQTQSKTTLLFSSPVLNSNENTLHIICGRTYAFQLQECGKLNVQLTWINDCLLYTSPSPRD